MTAASPIPEDRLEVRSDPDGVFHARRLIVADDPYQAGHYPDFLIYPGVFVVENVVRASLVVLAEAFDGRRFCLRRLRSARFTAPVRPGDQLLVSGGYTIDDEGRAHVRAVCRRDDGVSAATVRAIFDPEEDVCRVEPS